MEWTLELQAGMIFQIMYGLAFTLRYKGSSSYYFDVG
jgi:hypothetical protein